MFSGNAIRLVEASKNAIIDAHLLKCYLRLNVSKEPMQYGDELHEDAEIFGEDALLDHCTKTAKQWVEEMSERSLLTQTLEYTSQNDRFFLPMGPVLPHNKIISVTNVGTNKVLKENEDYVLFLRHDRTVVQLLRHKGKDPKIAVQYMAGFGELAEHVPMTLRNLVLHTAALIYEYRDRLTRSQVLEQVLHGTQAFRSYRLVADNESTCSGLETSSACGVFY